jgi:beta-lactamase regulating signal transducer with metallopeptidase domain
VNALLQIALSNALIAGGLALVAFGLGRLCRRPALAHALWLLVLLKLLTPPLLPVAVPWPEAAPAQEAAVAPILPAATTPADQPDPLPGPPPGAPAEAETAAAPVVAPGGEARAAEGDLPPVAAAPAPMAADMVPPLPAPATKPESLPAADFPWPLVLALVWAGGTVLWLGAAGTRLGRFHGLLAHARPAPAELQQEADELARRLGLARAPGVWLVPGVVSPMLWAVGRAPRLLIPADLLARLSAAQRAALLVHELAHLRRRDHWVRWLELAVLALYWWLPVAWWARRELQETEEECCDAWVVWALPGSAKAYAVALVETLDFLAEARPALPVAASGLGHLSLLRRRLTMIMRGDTPRALTRAGLLAVLGAGVLLLPLVPSWAQTNRSDRRAGEAEEQQPPTDSKERKARVDQLRKMEAEAQRMRAMVEQQKDVLEQKMRELDRQLLQIQRAQREIAEDELRRAKESRGGGGGFGGTPGSGGAGGKPGAGGMPGRRARPDVAQRLAEIEHKLDLILNVLEHRGLGPRDGRQPGGRGRPAAGPQPPSGGAGFPPPVGFVPGGGQPGLPGAPGGFVPGQFQPPGFPPPGGGRPGLGSGPGAFPGGLPPGGQAPLPPGFQPPGTPGGPPAATPAVPVQPPQPPGALTPRPVRP